MKTQFVALCVLAGLLNPSTVLAGGDDLTVEEVIAAVEPKPDDEQKAKIAEAVRTRAEAIAAWDRANAPKAAALAALAERFREARDADGLADALRQGMALQTERTRLVSSQTDRVMATLTPEQLAFWRGGLIGQDTARRFARAVLTPEQQDRVLAFCRGELLTRLKDGKALSAATAEIYAAAFGHTRDQILTDEQRAEHFPTPAQKAAKVEEARRQQAKPPKAPKKGSDGTTSASKKKR